MCRALARQFLLLLPMLSLFASGSDLHPLGKPLADAELRFVLQGAGCGDQPVAVEVTYQPYRARDVKSDWSLHLFNHPFRIGSDRITVQREEHHVVRFVTTARDSNLEFTVPLLAREEGYRKYQLAEVRVERLRFARWFKEPPMLDAGFGLVMSSDALRGRLRRGGLGADPLGGSLPLWPELRTVDVEVALREAPTLQLWDGMQKHHWDGWRQTTPAEWPGGRSIVARHIASPTVWWSHEYYAYPPQGVAPLMRPAPPAPVIPGVDLDVHWPEGGTLEFPEAIFDPEATGFGVRASRLTPRAREILAQAVTRRPGLEAGSVSADEWKELDAVAGTDEAERPIDWAMREVEGRKSVLVATRKTLTEPWLYFFGTAYDSDRRFVIRVVRLDPTPWSGPLPE